MGLTKADYYMKRDIENILNYGYRDENPRPRYSDGTPAHTISVNQVVRTYNLSKDEFPICTLRPMAWKTAIKEIFTIYQNPTNKIDEMENMGVSWWKPWDIGDGTIGQRYGATVKRYDLINNLIKDIIDDPYGRRKIVSLWQETDLHETKGLAPCAFLTMWNVRGKYLDMTLIQRSGDMITASGAGGMNEIQYAALLMMIARHTGYKAGVFCHFTQNEQIYDRHVDATKEILNRFEQNQGILLPAGTAFYYPPRSIDEIIEIGNKEIEEQRKNIIPRLILNPNKTNFYDMTINDFELKNYEPIKPQMKLDLGI